MSIDTSMSISNRELVFFFLSHKLSQRNYRPIPFQPEGAGEGTDEDKSNRIGNNGLRLNDGNGNGQLAPSPTPQGTEAVRAALLESVEEFELRYTLAFSDLSSQLPITPATAYGSFESVMDEVFRDSINWGRIVGLFAFGGALCVECVEKEMSHMVPRVAEWMTRYLDDHIDHWIQSNGGWKHFAAVFGSDAAAGARRTRDSHRRWMLVGAALLTGVLLGALLAKKHV
uniref:Putative Bcl-X1 n=1 Tax=Gadus morhua TaxID=8049 RepID=D2ITA2_GADMO|nr:putative Bcl-X1 [Gadus morhua]